MANFELGRVHSNPYARAFKPQPIVEVDGEDHEVKMAEGQLDYIIKSANELKGKLGGMEKNIPGWIQDHISKAHSYLHQANSGYHELGETKKSMKLTSLLSLNEDAGMNKDVKKFLDKSIGGMRAGSPPHLFAVKHTLIGALTDANFHPEAKKVPALFPKAEFEPRAYGENEKEAIKMYEYEIGPHIARICGYDGGDIVDAIGFYASMTIGRPVGEKIQKLVETMKEGSADGGKMAKTHVVYAINVQLKDGSYASPLRVAVKKGADAEQRAKMLAKKHIGKDFKSITAIGKALNPEKHTIKEDIEPQTKKIASLTGTRADAVKQFVSTHGLNITKLVKFIEKGKLSDRMDFVSAIAGKPNNPIQKKIIKMFSEAVKENKEPEIITQLRDIVKNQQYQVLKDPKTGKKVKVDMQSANVIVKVYDALGTQNKEKFYNSGLMGMQSTAFKLIK